MSKIIDVDVDLAKVESAPKSYLAGTSLAYKGLGQTAVNFPPFTELKTTSFFAGYVITPTASIVLEKLGKAGVFGFKDKGGINPLWFRLPITLISLGGSLWARNPQVRSFAFGSLLGEVPGLAGYLADMLVDYMTKTTATTTTTTTTPGTSASFAGTNVGQTAAAQRLAALRQGVGGTGMGSAVTDRYQGGDRVLGSTITDSVSFGKRVLS